MIELETPWQVSEKVRSAIIELALAHIKKVENDPEVKTKGDNFDYWYSYELEDVQMVDYKIYCGDEVCELKQDGKYEYTDPSTWSWDVACYAVNPPTEEFQYHSIDTDRTQYLFNYNKDGNRKIVFEKS